ncbi:MAG: hypothetical protein AAGG59_09990 [Bacteroidota bacterium]
MSENFNEFLPNPEEQEHSKLNPEIVLKRLRETVNTKYHERIIAIVTSSSKILGENEEVLSYAFHLQFTRHDNYTYPLLVAECENRDGSYPLKVQSHYGPPIDHGTIRSEEDFEKAIKEILKETRTRNVILSMY